MRLPRPQFQDSPEAARYMLAGWAFTTMSTLAVFAQRPDAALAICIPALCMFILGAFA